VIAFRLLTLVALFSQVAGVDVRSYRPLRPTSPDSEIHIDLPYTLGTHDFVVRELRGSLKVQGVFEVVSGRLVVPIASLDAGKKTLECHTREALGLDYARSKFPGEHVCDGDTLPPSGSDAIVFPEITFDWMSARILDDAGALGRGKSVRLEVLGRWTIHGVSRDDKLELTLTSAAGPPAHPTAFRVMGTAKICLADYGIEVKRALFIKAGDVASIRLNLVFAESK
jgi:polyisoprenoid-binding protein YceI